MVLLWLLPKPGVKMVSTRELVLPPMKLHTQMQPGIPSQKKSQKEYIPSKDDMSPYFCSMVKGGGKSRCCHSPVETYTIIVYLCTPSRATVNLSLCLIFYLYLDNKKIYHCGSQPIKKMSTRVNSSPFARTMTNLFINSIDTGRSVLHLRDTAILTACIGGLIC